MMSNDVSDAPGVKEISYPRFAAFYNRLMAWPVVRWRPVIQPRLKEAVPIQGSSFSVFPGSPRVDPHS